MTTFTFHNPARTSIGQFGESTIYRFRLADSGLSTIRFITIKDDNFISGGSGADSGFDLDWIQISPTLLSRATDVTTLSNINAFTFSDSSVTFQPGFRVPSAGQTQLTGTIDGRVNFPSATLNTIDGTAAGSGRISVGEAGKISFTLNSPLSPNNLFLYVAETGDPDGFEIEVSDVVPTATDSSQGINLIGTPNNDVIDLTQGSNQTIGLGNDSINGIAGKDSLNTGEGNDILIGGFGADTLTGSLGSDRFVFSGATKRQALRSSTLRSMDRITDFQFVQGDRFQLDFDNNLTSIELPKRLFNAGERKGSINKVAKAVYRDKNLKRSDEQPLRPNEAVFFSIGKRTYLSVNNGAPGFSARNDLVVNVTGIQFQPGDLNRQTLVADNYFA